MKYLLPQLENMLFGFFILPLLGAVCVCARVYAYGHTCAHKICAGNLRQNILTYTRLKNSEYLQHLLESDEELFFQRKIQMIIWLT